VKTHRKGRGEVRKDVFGEVGKLVLTDRLLNLFAHEFV
jgi:hypothetical protein